MDDETFWGLIAAARQDGDALIDALAGRTAAEIIEFDRIASEKVRDAFRWDLWAVAYIMNGGCSDDGFDYFITWLIGRGRDAYHAALASPARAADGCDPDDEPFENEMLWWAPAQAYARVTGQDPDAFYELAHRVSRTIQGEAWDEDAVGGMYPELAARFGL